MQTFQHVQTDPPTKEGLAQLVIQLIQYQENKLGKNASDPPFLRLPVCTKFYPLLKHKNCLLCIF